MDADQTKVGFVSTLLDAPLGVVRQMSASADKEARKSLLDGLQADAAKKLQFACRPSAGAPLPRGSAGVGRRSGLRETYRHHFMSRSACVLARKIIFLRQMDHGNRSLEAPAR